MAPFLCDGKGGAKMQQLDECELILNKEDIGRRIFEMRKIKGLSQMKLSEMVQMSGNSISNIELGKQLCSTSKLLLFARVLDTSIEYLLHGIETKVKISQEEQDLNQELLGVWNKISLTDKRRILAGIKAFYEAV